jgi:hypothetical protein
MMVLTESNHPFQIVMLLFTPRGIKMMIGKIGRIAARHGTHVAHLSA